MNTRHLNDITGTTHTLALDSAGIVLDGKPCRLLIKDTQLELLSSDPDLGVVTISPAAFWYALAGGEPTAEDAGVIQAHMLASFTTMQEIATLIGRVRPLLDDIDRHLHLYRQPPLPSYRFSPFVAQLLATLDGTEEQTLAVARVLKQAPETICEWAMHVGKSISLPLTNQESQHPPAPEVQADEQPTGLSSADMGEEEAEPMDDARHGKRGFLWMDEHERLLEEAYDASQLPSNNARIKEIASRFGWPYHVVDYRLRQLLKKRKQAEQPHQVENRAVEIQPIAVSQPGVDARPAVLPRGAFLWDVRINGTMQRWQLDIVYGQFPYKAGSHVVYREQEYVLLQAWNSMIEVTVVEEAKARVEERSPALPVLAVAAV